MVMGRECRIMVCVTLQKTCKRLIDAGAQIARMKQSKLFVVHVSETTDEFLGNPGSGKALEYLFQISKDAGAEMTVFQHENVLGSLVEFAKKNRIDQIILGASDNPTSDESIYHYLKDNLISIDIICVPP